MILRMPPTDLDPDAVDGRSMSDSSVDRLESMPDDLPPSCRCVLQALRYHGPELSRQALLEETGLPERTLDEALHRCEYRGFLFRARKSGNLRQTTATLADN
jgi:DNA-binding MarR family transcriptional regulator